MVFDEDMYYALRDESPEGVLNLLSHATLDSAYNHTFRNRGLGADWFTTLNTSIANLRPAASISCALLDSTTLENALALLDGNFPLNVLPAGAVLDLSTFISAFVFEDELTYLRHDSDYSGRISALFQEAIPCASLDWKDSEATRLAFENLWWRSEVFSSKFIREPRFFGRWSKWWKTIIGADVSDEILRAPQEYRTYYSSVEEIAIREAIVNHPEGYEGVTAIGPGLGLTEEFIAMNSVRAVFYFFVASLLNLTYHASVYRTYFKELLAEMMISASEPTLRVLRFIEREYRVGLVEEGTFACVEQVAPLLLSASFRKVKTCEDVRERIVELRSLARPFREKRTELTLAVRDRDFAACKKLAGAVRAEARRLAEAEYLAGRTAAGRFVISLGGTRPLFGTLGHLLVAFSPLPAEVKEIIKTRFVRPEVWVFQRIGSDARQVLDVWPSLLGVLRARGFSPEKYEMELLSEGMARLSNASL